MFILISFLIRDPYDFCTDFSFRHSRLLASKQENYPNFAN